MEELIDKDELIKYLKMELSAVEIAKLLGVSRQAVYLKAHQLGYERSRKWKEVV